MDDELVLLHLDRGTYYSVNEVGARAWELFDGARSIDDTVAEVCSEYDAPRDVVDADIRGLVAELMAEGLLQVDGETG